MKADKSGGGKSVEKLLERIATKHILCYFIFLRSGNIFFTSKIGLLCFVQENSQDYYKMSKILKGSPPFHNWLSKPCDTDMFSTNQ